MNLSERHQQKEKMLEDVKESKSFMKKISIRGEIIELWGTPELIECGIERKPSILILIDLSDRKLATHVMRMWWRPYIGSLARRLLCQTRSKALEIYMQVVCLYYRTLL